MKIKKCMWCLKEFETDSSDKYCSAKCKNKSEDVSKDNVKKEVKGGIFQTIIDAVTSMF